MFENARQIVGDIHRVERCLPGVLTDDGISQHVARVHGLPGCGIDRLRERKTGFVDRVGHGLGRSRQGIAAARRYRSTGHRVLQRLARCVVVDGHRVGDGDGLARVQGAGPCQLIIFEGRRVGGFAVDRRGRVVVECRTRQHARQVIHDLGRIEHGRAGVLARHRVGHGTSGVDRGARGGICRLVHLEAGLVDRVLSRHPRGRDRFAARRHRRAARGVPQQLTRRVSVGLYRIGHLDRLTRVERAGPLELCSRYLGVACGFAVDRRRRVAGVGCVFQHTAQVVRHARGIEHRLTVVGRADRVDDRVAGAHRRSRLGIRGLLDRVPLVERIVGDRAHDVDAQIRLRVRELPGGAASRHRYGSARRRIDAGDARHIVRHPGAARGRLRDGVPRSRGREDGARGLCLHAVRTAGGGRGVVLADRPAGDAEAELVVRGEAVDDVLLHGQGVRIRAAREVGHREPTAERDGAQVLTRRGIHLVQRGSARDEQVAAVAERDAIARDSRREGRDEGGRQLPGSARAGRHRVLIDDTNLVIRGDEQRPRRTEGEIAITGLEVCDPPDLADRYALRRVVGPEVGGRARASIVIYAGRGIDGTPDDRSWRVTVTQVLRLRSSARAVVYRDLLRGTGRAVVDREPGCALVGDAQPVVLLTIRLHARRARARPLRHVHRDDLPGAVLGIDRVSAAGENGSRHRRCPDAADHERGGYNCRCTDNRGNPFDDRRLGRAPWHVFPRLPVQNCHEGKDA